MKKNLLLLLIMLAFSVSGYSQTGQYKKVKSTSTVVSKKIASHTAKPDKKTKALRKQHAKFLANTPFKKVLQLSNSERKGMGIPPNKYYESEWELTMNPALGRPTPENIEIVRKKLAQERQQAIATGRTPGDASDNNWVERGPTNVGGRTRAIMFDPNDATKETVFAGGVSGGLWKNTNISNAASIWTRVNIPENLAVSCITYDPNNTNIFYVGTGESYVGGDVNGDGVWKSANGGATWAKVFGGITGPTTFQSSSNITINSPAGIAGIYTCYATTAFGSPVTSTMTADIVLVDDGLANPTEGCNPLINGASVAGKIALIKRGTCPFVDKVNNAQNAGAIAVIMMNNVSGTPVAMGGTDGAITIPSVMISKQDGDLLVAALGSSTVNGSLNPTIPGGYTGNLVPGQQHINDIKVRNNGGVSEVYVAAGDSFYGAANATTYLGGPGFGLYKSVNGGSNWNEVTLPLTVNGNKHCPNNIEIGSDNKIWLSTTNSVVFGDGGGMVFSSADGNAFTQKYIVTGGDRTQIAVSATTPDKVYVLSEISGGVTMKKTINGFGATTDIVLIDDADTGITVADFTRGQAFYDLMLEVDPTDDQKVYVGGIDLFRSADGGGSWAQISKWSNNNNLAGLSCSLIHGDQHAMTFKPGTPNAALFGNDGGVFYCSSLSTAATAATMSSRNSGFNVTQFYSLGVAPTNAVSGLTGDYFVAGAQDNGTQYFINAAQGPAASTQAQGGDGAYSMFDQGADKYYITNYVYNQSINYRTTAGATRIINTESTSNGAFIAPMTLDSSLDLLYSDYSTSAPLYQIRRYNNLKTGTVGKTALTNPLLTSSPTAMTVSKYTTASTTLLVGTRNGKVLRLLNANAVPTWADITGPSFVGSVSDVEFGASNNDIFVTFHNYSVVSIWYSADAGVTWQNKEGNFPDIPVKCIMQNPLNLNEVIIGTELGVWFTNTFNTANPVWNQSYNGMSNVKVTDMDLRNDNSVFASTYGRGIFSGLFTSVSLSTSDIASSTGVKIYPNPTSDVLNISVAGYAGPLSVKLYDINGKEVYSTDFTDFVTEKSLRLNGLPSGTYILKMKGQNISHTSKVVLN